MKKKATQLSKKKKINNMSVSALKEFMKSVGVNSKAYKEAEKQLATM